MKTYKINGLEIEGNGNPSPKLRALLERDEPFVQPAPTPEGDSWTPTRIAAAVHEAVLNERIGRVIAQVMDQRKVSVRRMASLLGVAPSRVAQLRDSENLELKTLVRALAALDCEVELIVRPREGTGVPIRAKLG
ncbi:MAG: helix-turn-helix domain-containing protein [Meiothermus silvanus]|nr:helix-turn-helix domain-containing protein [Allomeiothermus silvanus]